MQEEDTILCPKGCGTKLPISLMHEHYESCTNKVPIPNPLVADIIQSIPTWPVTKVPYVEPEKVIKAEKLSPSFCPKCGSEYIIDQYFKVCTKCKKIHMRPKMFWWIIFRYGFMIMWLSLLGGFILGIYSYHKVFP